MMGLTKQQLNKLKQNLNKTTTPEGDTKQKLTRSNKKGDTITREGRHEPLQATLFPMQRHETQGAVLGIDPGSQKCGWGIVDSDTKPVVLGWGVIKASGSQLLRLKKIYQGLREIPTRYKMIDTIAFEDGFIGTNKRTAEVIGKARGLAVALAAEFDLQIYCYAPKLIKKAVCHGKASKVQVQRMVREILGVKEEIEEDMADALAVAICHLHRR